MLHAPKGRRSVPLPGFRLPLCLWSGPAVPHLPAADLSGLSVPLMYCSRGVLGQGGAAAMWGGVIWQVFYLGLNHST